MTGYYRGSIKVVCPDMMCFRASPATLEALSTSHYDPYAWSDPDPEPIETICVSEWQRRRNELRRPPVTK